MIVKFEYPWFAPTIENHRDAIQSTSGKFYKKGVQNIPDDLRDVLPSSAIILEDIPQLAEKPELTYRDFDQERKDEDTVQATLAEVELERKRDRMANARAAKKTKK